MSAYHAQIIHTRHTLRTDYAHTAISLLNFPFTGKKLYSKSFTVSLYMEDVYKALTWKLH